MTAIRDERAANVRRLQPLRVLLSGRDRRFIRVMSFLLTRRGYEVSQASPEQTVGAAESHRADVVLLETSDSRVATVRKLAALQALPVPPSVLVVVEDEGHERWTGLPAIPKWTPIDVLASEIEAAALSRHAPLIERASSQL